MADTARGDATIAAYAYPWDVAGDPRAAERLAALGLNEVTLAAVYHATRAVTPRHPRHRFVTAERTAAYVPLDESRWRDAPIALAAADDSFVDAAEALRANGLLPVTRQLHLTISLPLQNQPELDALIQQLYNPASPNFRKYLTPAEFTARFGPSESDYAALLEFVQTNGFQTMPYIVMVQVNYFDGQRITGMTSAGETVTWQRMA